MKRLALMLCAMLLWVVSFGTGRAEEEIDFDLSAFNGGMTYAQMIQVCNAPESYVGKVFRVQGKFNYSETREMAKIIFSDKSGCCELAMMFRTEQPLVYPEDYPALYNDITITARLATDGEDPDSPCWLADAVLEWEKEGIAP